VFRSRRREVVFPQAEHARLAAALASAWSDAFAPVRLPLERFVRGVALHDRGYGEHDADEIGQVSRARWLAIQERGFAATGEDPLVDLVVALHVRRLVSSGEDDASRRVLAAMDDALPALVRDAGVSPEDAAAADRITDLCDRISFDVCLEAPDAGEVDVLHADGSPARVSYTVDGHGGVELDPWPLAPPALGGTLLGYAAPAYPDDLEPVRATFSFQPTTGARR
jgi:hypothetical protein